MTTGNRWGRAIGAGVLVEVSLTLVYILIIAVLFKRVLRREMAEVEAVSLVTMRWGGIVGGLILTFLFTRWALRPLSSAHGAHALVVGTVALAAHALAGVGFFTHGHGPWWMFVAANVAIAAGAAGGWMLARRNSGAVPPSPEPGSPAVAQG